MTFNLHGLPDLHGRVYIVTGGNSGIGFYTVTHLAEHGAHVYMGARSPKKAAAAIAQIQQACASAQIDVLEMDHMDLRSVVAAAKRVLARETALHGLVNNAGIMATPFEMTRDGHEAQWQTNYLAHWVLTEQLLPLMQQTAAQTAAWPGSVRIVNVSSSGHLSAPKVGIEFDDLTLKNNATFDRYGQSKLANILHTTTLHCKYGPGSPSARSGKGEIWASSVHPGLTDTNLEAAADMTGTLRMAVVMRALKMTISADKGSSSSLFCVASDDMKADQSGGYFDILKRWSEMGWRSGPAKDAKLAQRLEDWTQETMRREGWLS